MTDVLKNITKITFSSIFAWKWKRLNCLQGMSINVNSLCTVNFLH